MKKNLVFVCVLVALLSVFASVMAQNESSSFSEKFRDIPYYDNGWEAYIRLGNPTGNYIEQSGRLSFHLPTQDTTIYMHNHFTDGYDGTVEATFENILSMDSSYGIVCRYHDDSWYEFRINVSGPFAGSYSVYKYDQYLKDQGKNPYVLLHPGMDRYNSMDIVTGLNKKNTLKMTCIGDEIRIYINDKEQRPLGLSTIHDSDWEDGEAGFMMMNVSHSNAQMDITKFSYTPEE